MKTTKKFRVPSLLCAIAISLLAVPNISHALNPGDVIVAGNTWMGGRGVDVHWNAGDCCGTWGNSTNICPHSGQPVYSLWKWQCDELGNRLYVLRDWYCGTFLKGDGTIEDWAYQVFDGAPLMGMNAYTNNSGYVPIPGDMVIWWANCGNFFTHLAVVDYVDAGHVYVCEQNVDTTGRATLNRSGNNGSSLIRADGKGCIRGIVHSPNNIPAASVIVDNSSAGFSVTGTSWSTGTGSTDKYGTDYRYRSTASVSEPAQWVGNVTGGTHSVYAWWPQGANRSTSAPYIVYHGATSSSVRVNQQINGGKWNLLGTWSDFVSGNNTVKLSCWTTTGSVVLADAVKWQ